MDRKLIIVPGEIPIERDLTGPEQAQLNRDRANSRDKEFFVPFHIAVQRMNDVGADAFFARFDLANRKRQTDLLALGFSNKPGFWRTRLTQAGLDPDVILARP